MRNLALLLAQLPLLLPTRALLLTRLPLLLAAGAGRSRMLVIIPPVLSRGRECERQHQAGKP